MGEFFGADPHPGRAADAPGAALVGGGSTPRPGEISLAHNGVLFLDELPEFPRHVLDVLREPLESGQIVISRAARQSTFPAEFQLVAAIPPRAGDEPVDLIVTSEDLRATGARPDVAFEENS